VESAGPSNSASALTPAVSDDGWSTRLRGIRALLMFWGVALVVPASIWMWGAAAVAACIAALFAAVGLSLVVYDLATQEDPEW
jgi:hypothetical protein